MGDSDDDTYTIPLKDQRAFGAGIKRKRVQFVPSSSTLSSGATAQSHPKPASTSAGDVYLSIVLKTKTKQDQTPEEDKNTRQSTPDRLDVTKCSICSAPLDPSSTLTEVPHEASLVHQACLEHSYPPSAIDRSRKGLAILQAHGWNPDDRRGLGAAGEGILHPIKPSDNKDKVGVGAKALPAAKLKKAEKLDAAKVVKRDKEDRKKAERLRSMFYYNDDLEKYLGPNG